MRKKAAGFSTAAAAHMMAVGLWGMLAGKTVRTARRHHQIRRSDPCTAVRDYMQAVYRVRALTRKWSSTVRPSAAASTPLMKSR